MPEETSPDNNTSSQHFFAQIIRSFQNAIVHNEKHVQLPSSRVVELRHEVAVRQRQEESDESTARGHRLLLKSSQSIHQFIQSSRDCLFPFAQDDTEFDNLGAFESMEDLNSKKSLLLDIGYALTTFGAPAHRLEYFMEMMCLNFGFLAESVNNPTAFWIQFYEARVKSDSGYKIVPKTVHFYKVPATAYNLTKMYEMEELAVKIFMNQISVADAKRAVKDISAISHSFYDHYMLIIFSRFLFAVVISIFFDASIAELLVAIVASFSASLLAIASRKNPDLAKVNTICTGVASGIIAIIFKLSLSKVYQISVFVVALAGSISLFPGFTMVISISEIATHNVVSGTARMISALLAAFQVTFGILIPQKFATLIPLFQQLPDPVARSPATIWARLALVPVLVTAFLIFLKAPITKLSFVIITIAASCSTIVNYFTLSWIGSREVATFLSAFSIGCFSQIFSWISKTHSGLLVRSTCIMFLLPSTLSYHSFNALLGHDMINGISVFYEIISMCVSLTIGLAASTIIIPPRKKIRL